jgi:hypothetical protein
MRGDALASGNKSANFPQAPDTQPKPKGVKVARACKCGSVIWDEQEYAEHVKTCPDAQR